MSEKMDISTTRLLSDFDAYEIEGQQKALVVLKHFPVVEEAAPATFEELRLTLTPDEMDRLAEALQAVAASCRIGYPPSSDRH